LDFLATAWCITSVGLQISTRPVKKRFLPIVAVRILDRWWPMKTMPWEWLREVTAGGWVATVEPGGNSSGDGPGPARGEGMVCGPGFARCGLKKARGARYLGVTALADRQAFAIAKPTPKHRHRTRARPEPEAPGVRPSFGYKAGRFRASSRASHRTGVGERSAGAESRLARQRIPADLGWLHILQAAATCTIDGACPPHLFTPRPSIGLTQSTPAGSDGSR
jgi:hypothetical protein